MGGSRAGMSYQRGGRWVLLVSQYGLAFVKRAVLFRVHVPSERQGARGRNRLTALNLRAPSNFAPSTLDRLWRNLTKSLFRVLIWKGTLEQGTWRCPSHHHSQQGRWVEKISGSFLAILDSECPSQMPIVFVLNVFILLYWLVSGPFKGMVASP